MKTAEASPSAPIIGASALRARLDARTPLVLLDARPLRRDYDAGHLAGALHAPSATHLSRGNPDGAAFADGGRHPLPRLDDWCRTLGAWGIRPESLVVVYDDQSGANAAARAWWMLESVGHDRVRVLDGGLSAAIREGLPTTTIPPLVEATPAYPAASWRRPTVDIEKVDRIRTDSSWKILDVRSHERWLGRVEPLDEVAGHIPGSANLPFAENLSGGLFRSRTELRELYEEFLGGTHPDHLVVHCGSGVTACHTLLALEIAGLSGASLYVGGWSQWSRSGRPREPEGSADVGKRGRGDTGRFRSPEPPRGS